MKNRKSILSVLLIAVLFLSLTAGVKNTYAHTAFEPELQSRETVVGENQETYTPSASTTYVYGHEVWESKTIEGDVVIQGGAVLTTNGTVSVSGTIYVYGTMLTYGTLTAGGITGTNYFFGYSKELKQGSLYNRAARINVGTLIVDNLNLIRLTGPSLVSLEILQNPAKVNYIPGEPVDLSGLLVQGNFSDGSTEDLTYRVALREYDASTTGEKEIFILIENQAVSFKVNYAENRETLKKLAGSSRYTTAVEVSKASYASADTAIVVSGLDYPDALAAGPLAFSEQAPILLTQRNFLNPATKTELLRLGATKVVLLGGTNAISQAAEDELTAMGIAVERISGTNRYYTASLIASRMKAANEGLSEVFLVSGQTFPDALAAGSAAAKIGSPILLTRGALLSPAAKDFILNNNIGKVNLIGGSAVISAEVEAELNAMGLTVQRYAGTNRAGTSVVIAGSYFTASSEAVFVNGWNYPDALSAAPYAAKINAPIMLVNQSTVSPSITTYISGSPLYLGTIVGGEAAVGEASVSVIRQALEAN